MHRFRLSSAFPVLSGLFLAAGLATAAAPSKSGPPAESKAIAPPGRHAHMHCMADSAEMAKLRQAVQEALKSGDKGKMKSALEKVEAHFARMQDEIEKCKAAMGTDDRPPMGKDGDMMCGRDHGADDSSEGAHSDAGHAKHPMR